MVMRRRDTIILLFMGVALLLFVVVLVSGLSEDSSELDFTLVRAETAWHWCKSRGRSNRPRL